MIVKVQHRPLKSMLTWSQRVLFVCGFVLLGYCAYAIVDAYLFQEHQSREFERLLAERHAASMASPNAAFHMPKVPEATPMNGMIGRVEIERLGVSVMVMEGDDGKTLRRAAGHVPGTALPGQPGNIGVTAHRDTFFRPLRNIRMDDVVTLETLQGEFRYRVISTQVVTPRDVYVLDPTETETLTLVTCYPFYYVGNAPNRFIVHAERIAGSALPAKDTYPKDAARPRQL